MNTGRVSAISAARPLAPRAPPTGRAPRWLWLALLAVVLTIALGAGWDRLRNADAGTDPAQLRGGRGAATFAAALAAVQQDVATARGSLVLAPGEWLREEELSRALMARFRLAGDYADLAEAQRLLDGALARTLDPAGPALTKAALAVLVHRLDEADAALARVDRWGFVDSLDRAEVLTLRGDIALQRGQPAAALTAWAEARTIAPAAWITLREALLGAQRGQHEAGVRALETLIAAPGQQTATLAALALQRANLAYATGDWDGAAAWVAAANRVYPGYWLAEAYAAQGEALAGRPAVAIRRLSAIATRTGRPEAMDALAHLLRLEGQGAASRAWAAKAAAGWADRAALLPEAASQHFAEHELAVGSVGRALALAEADVAARPAPQGIALLARALILSGRPREALRWLDQSRAAGFTSAGALMLRADALAALGNSAASEAARAAALAINPKAADPAARLIWFGHD